MCERTTGMDDLDAREVNRCVDAVIDLIESNFGLSVQDVYAVGSFAKGNAKWGLSDLDLRVIVDEVSEETSERIQMSLDGPLRDTPGGVAYLDVHTTTELDESTAVNLTH